MRRSRSRSPVRHFNSNNRSGRARNMLDSSSLEPIKFKKESFGRNRGGRRSFQNYDDRDERRPMNRHERRAHLQERELEDTNKPMIVLDDPSHVPRGAYFEHDRREVVPGGGGGLFGRGGHSNFRSDQMASRDSDTRDRSFRRQDDDRRSERGGDHRERQERRTEYQGYRSDPFERNSESRRGFHHHQPSNYRNRNQHDDRRSNNQHDDRRSNNQHDDRRSNNQHDDRRGFTDRRPTYQQRNTSPTIWKHDKFEELEEKEES